MNCETLMLSEFIKIVCEVVPQPDYWLDILDEYATLKNDHNTKALFELQRDIAVIEYDLFLIEQIVNQLSKYWSFELGKLLRKEFGYEFEYKNDDGLTLELEQTIQEARGKLMEKSEMLFELEQLKPQTTKKITEMEYLVQIKSYEQWYGQPIPLKTTSIKEYLSIQLLYNMQRKK